MRTPRPDAGRSERTRKYRLCCRDESWWQDGHCPFTAAPCAVTTSMFPSIATSPATNPPGTNDDNRNEPRMTLIPMRTNVSLKLDCIRSESDPGFHAD